MTEKAVVSQVLPTVSFWLCRVFLCHFHQNLPGQRLQGARGRGAKPIGWCQPGHHLLMLLPPKQSRKFVRAAVEQSRQWGADGAPAGLRRQPEAECSLLHRGACSLSAKLSASTHLPWARPRSVFPEAVEPGMGEPALL